jgi:hypothetical protein
MARSTIIWALMGTLVLLGVAMAQTTVTITAPDPAIGTVSVVANTNTTHKMWRLEVLVDGAVEKTCTSRPCTYSWDTTTVPNGAHTVRGRRVATNGTVIRSTLKTVQVQNEPPVEGEIPGLPQWEAVMVSGGTKWCDALPQGASCCNESQMWYYDGAWVAYQIADYTGTNQAYWQQCAQKSESIYRPHVLASSNTMGGWRVFPHGLYEDFQRTGDATSRQAALLLAQSPWAKDNNALWLEHGIPAVDHSTYTRAIAYALNAHMIAERLGEPHRAWGDRLMEGLLEHIDRWFITKDAPSLKFFMVGLNLEALISWYDLHPDARIPPAVKIALDGLWTYWNATGKYFPYCRVVRVNSPLGPPEADCNDDFGSVNRVLNNLIGHAYAWHYRLTGDVTSRDRGDQVFAGAAAYAKESGGGGSGKEFSQLYRSSFRYVRDRLAAEE